MRGHAVRFGLFAVLTLGLTAYIGLQIAKVQFGGTYTVNATFTDVTGLGEGDDVKVAGVKVGQVAAVGTDGTGRAEVELSLDEGVELPADSEAAIRWRNLLGQRVVYLEPGESDAMLQSGDEVARTRSVVDIGALVNELGGLVTAVDPAQLNSLLEAVSGALEGNEENVDDLLDGAGELLTVLAQREAALGSMLEDFETVSGALADRDRQVRTMVENLTLLTGTFADNEALVDSTLVELGQYTRGLDTVLTANEGELKRLIANLARVTDTVTDNIDEVEAQLTNLPGALKGLHSVTNRGEFIVIEALCFATGPPPCPTPVVSTTGSRALTGSDAIANLSPTGERP